MGTIGVLWSEILDDVLFFARPLQESCRLYAISPEAVMSAQTLEHTPGLENSPRKAQGN